MTSKSNIEVVDETFLQALWGDEQNLRTQLQEFKIGLLKLIERVNMEVDQEALKSLEKSKFFNKHQT